LRTWVKIATYMAIGTILFSFSILFFLWSVSYMEHAMVATSLLSALIGFSLLSGSLYMFRLSAYVYGVEKGASPRQETQV